MPSIDTQAKSVNIHPSWYSHMEAESNKEYFKELKSFLLTEKQHYKVFPPSNLIFSAFNRTPFDQVKVVIIGQDPYHGVGQANGLCFSVSSGIKAPPSLVNIFKEIHSDLGIKIPTTGNLEPWADQGVLLLNATLTVRAHSAGSHQNKGWEFFTDTVIKTISDKKQNIVFLLWGKFAQAKEVLIDTKKHYVLKAAHPSPFSAYNGFLGCKHFSLTNRFLEEKAIKPINWEL